METARDATALRNLFTERYQGQQTHLEVLQAEWNADDGQAENRSQAYVEQCDLYASEDYPDDVHEDGQESGIVRTGNDLTTERPEGKACHLEELDTKRNAYDAQAEDESGECVIETDQESS
jgi:hypothetical protein